MTKIGRLGVKCLKMKLLETQKQAAGMPQKTTELKILKQKKKERGQPLQPHFYRQIHTLSSHLNYKLPNLLKIILKSQPQIRLHTM